MNPLKHTQPARVTSTQQAACYYNGLYIDLLQIKKLLTLFSMGKDK